MIIYENYVKNKQKKEFYDFCQKNYKYSKNGYYLTNEQQMIKLNNYKKFILSAKNRSMKFKAHANKIKNEF